MENKNIYTAISNIMGKVGAIGKDKKNTQQNYSFRGIDDMYNALNKHLVEEKVFATSTVLDMKREERQTKSGGNLIYTVLTMKFDFFADDGSSVSSTTIGEAMDSGDKSGNKAMSTAYKYALMQLFCIPTEEEKDTEYQSHEVAPKTSPDAQKGTKVESKSPTMTKVPKDAYKAARIRIEGESDIEQLGKLKEHVLKSVNLTEEQKLELSDEIDAKILDVPFL